MMEKGSFILLYRRLTNWQWYKDMPTKCVFLHLLLKAEWRDTMYGDMLIKRGQILTSENELSTETGLSRQQVRTAINHLVETNDITKQSTHRKTLITVENYGKYQGETVGWNQDINQEVNQETNQVSTKYQPSDNQPTIYINKNNKNNNINNNITRARARHTSGVPIQAREPYYLYPDTYPPTMKQEHRDNLKAMREQIQAGIRDYERTFGEDDYDPMTAEVEVETTETGERKWYTYQDTLEKRRRNEAEKKHKTT